VTESNSQPFSVGAPVQLAQEQAYLKTADSMPMLRPGDLVAAGEEGEVMALLPLDQYAVRFRRGTYVLSGEALLPREPA